MTNDLMLVELSDSELANTNGGVEPVSGTAVLVGLAAGAGAVVLGVAVVGLAAYGIYCLTR